MPRTSRGGFVHHVLNRGNGRSDVFHKDDDLDAFVNLMREAHEKVPMRPTGSCLMTNHFHLLLWLHEDGDLSRWMQSLMTSHVRRGYLLAAREPEIAIAEVVGHPKYDFRSDVRSRCVVDP